MLRGEAREAQRPLAERGRPAGKFLLIWSHLGYNGIASLGPVTYRLETNTIAVR